MDYGVYLKTITVNPNRRHKNYTVQSKFEGSLRQIRGAVLKQLLVKKLTATQLVKIIKKDPTKTKHVIWALEKEKLIKRTGAAYTLN
jgi:A/G-specific adenine glycosylase